MVSQSFPQTVSEYAEPQERQETAATIEAAGIADRETAEPQEPESPACAYDWSSEEREMLAKIIMAEAEGESTEGKALVGLVVLNRVLDRQFPDTIEEVIFQKNQFTPAVPGGRYWTTTPNEDCYAALALIQSGWDESQGALFFESSGKDGWHSQNLEFLYQVGGHKFYR